MISLLCNLIRKMISRMHITVNGSWQKQTPRNPIEKLNDFLRQSKTIQRTIVNQNVGLSVRFCGSRRKKKDFRRNFTFTRKKTKHLRFDYNCERIKALNEIFVSSLYAWLSLKRLNDGSVRSQSSMIARRCFNFPCLPFQSSLFPQSERQMMINDKSTTSWGSTEDKCNRFSCYTWLASRYARNTNEKKNYARSLLFTKQHLRGPIRYHAFKNLKFWFSVLSDPLFEQ